MKWYSLWLMLWIVLLTVCSRCRGKEETTINVSLPNHVAVDEIAFVHFTPEQIEINPHNASVICRVFPSSSPTLEDHEIICFSNLEQYGVRLGNGTQMSCH